MVIPFAIGVVDAKESSGKSGSLAKCHKQRLVDLPLGIDEDAAKEQNQSSDRENRSGDKLCVWCHVREILCKDIPEKGSFANVLELECYVLPEIVLYRRFLCRKRFVICLK